MASRIGEGYGDGAQRRPRRANGPAQPGRKSRAKMLQDRLIMGTLASDGVDGGAGPEIKHQDDLGRGDSSRAGRPGFHEWVTGGGLSSGRCRLQRRRQRGRPGNCRRVCRAAREIKVVMTLDARLPEESGSGASSRSTPRRATQTPGTLPTGRSRVHCSGNEGSAGALAANEEDGVNVLGSSAAAIDWLATSFGWLPISEPGDRRRRRADDRSWQGYSRADCPPSCAQAGRRRRLGRYVLSGRPRRLERNSTANAASAAATIHARRAHERQSARQPNQTCLADRVRAPAD